jgi:hypothetical protein
VSSRRFNNGGIQQDYVRCLLSGSIPAHNVTIAALFARELDNTEFQNIAQFGTNGSNNSRALIGIPSSGDQFRAAQGSTGGSFASATTAGALTSAKWYVGVGRFISTTSRAAQRTGSAAATNATANTSGNYNELLIARRGLSTGGTFESFPGWLKWVAFWRTALLASESQLLCDGAINGSVDPRTIQPEAIVAHVDLSDRKGVLWAPRNALTFNIGGDPSWSTFGPYAIRTKRRRIFVPSGAITGTLNKTLDDATLDASGSVATDEILGTVNKTLDAATADASGTVAIEGSAAKTLDDATAAGQGGVTVEGSLGKTLDDATLEASDQEQAAPQQTARGGDDAPYVGRKHRGYSKQRALLKLKKDRELVASLRSIYRDLTTDPATRERAQEVIAAPINRRNDETPAQYETRLSERANAFRAQRLREADVEVEIALRLLHRELLELQQADDEQAIEQLLAQVL